MKFVRNGKLVTIGGEHAMVVSHLSYFSYIDADEDVGIQFQALYVASNEVKKQGTFISSFEDAR